jgi:hypothetical protein
VFQKNPSAPALNKINFSTMLKQCETVVLKAKHGDLPQRVNLIDKMNARRQIESMKKVIKDHLEKKKTNLDIAKEFHGDSSITSEVAVGNEFLCLGTETWSTIEYILRTIHVSDGNPDALSGVLSRLPILETILNAGARELKLGQGKSLSFTRASPSPTVDSNSLRDQSTSGSGSGSGSGSPLRNHSGTQSKKDARSNATFSRNSSGAKKDARDNATFSRKNSEAKKDARSKRTFSQKKSEATQRPFSCQQAPTRRPRIATTVKGNFQNFFKNPPKIRIESILVI